MTANVIETHIASEIGAGAGQVRAAVELLDGGATVPFVARYRKEATGGLDDVQLRALERLLDQLRSVETRRLAVLAALRSAGRLDGILERRILDARSLVEIEDLYAPFRPRHRSRADVARERGLEPLALAILEGDPSSMDLAPSFVSGDVPDAAAALDGARDIVVERISDDAALVAALRTYFVPRARIRSRVRPGKEEEGRKFADYHDREEACATIAGNRILAMLRAEKEEIVTLDIDVDRESTDAVKPLQVVALNFLGVPVPPRTIRDEWIAAAFRRTWVARLHPRLCTEVVSALRTRAQDEATQVFSRNLRDVLLRSPAGAKVVLGLDPGIRTGVKAAVVDATGALVATDTIYPFQPRNDDVGSAARIRALVARHRVDLVAVGNGTGGRETTALVERALSSIDVDVRPVILVVSEAGASVYSASEIASNEMPDVDVSLRGAVSIARRVQDPLAELVKIDPKAIGVGQYQHDLDPARLGRALDAVVEDAVNAVGVNLNTASVPLLTRVSGLGPSLAQAIVVHRETTGAFASRAELLSVRGIGPAVFEQCAGFLRVVDGVEPLDGTGVHPEAYDLARSIASSIGRDVRSILGDPDALRKVVPSRFVDASRRFGLPTVSLVIAELEKPGRDPRPVFRTAEFSEGVREFSDLAVGMRLQGTITNVAAFGAFVDVGVHHDGLVHRSAVTERRVADPLVGLRVGAVVDVTVVSVDPTTKRIGLSMLRDPLSVPDRRHANPDPRSEGRRPRKDSAGRGSLGDVLAAALAGRT